MAIKTDYPGIDYSLGRSNHDGIAAYGLINANTIMSEALNNFELNYIAACPECGTELTDDLVSQLDSEDMPCPACHHVITDSDQVYGDEPSSQTYEKDGYSLAYDNDSNVIWVFKSPIAINAQYCSPCMPGAGNLDSPCDTGVLTYALGLDWFDEYSPAPYTQDDIKSV